MSRILRALAGAILLIVFIPSIATAGDCDWDDPETIGCEIHGGGPKPDRPVYTVPGPWTEYRYVPTCSGNKPEGGFDTLCGAAVYTCPEDDETNFWVYARTVYPAADHRAPSAWKRVRTECRGPDDPPEGGPPVITTWMIREAAERTAPKTVVHAEPATESYVNVPNNFYVDSAPTTTSVTLIGITIPITFTPTTFSWSFGDGASGSGAGVRKAVIGAAGAVEHDYRRQGTYGITATRAFSVVATLPGGETLTVDVPVSNTSVPYELGVREIQSLVTNVD